MVRWCSFCQTFLGETPPLLDYAITHAICERCEARLEAGERLVEQREPVIAFFRALFDAARIGDQSTCRALAERGQREGRDTTAMLVGMLQPGLESIGRAWEYGTLSVAEEHRFTAWCQAVLSFLPRPRAPIAPLDLLLFVAPGNLHDLGIRFFERVVTDAGFSCRAIVPELPLQEIRALIQTHAPRWVGFSCGLPGSVEPARRLARELGLERVMLGGQAFRASPAAWEINDAHVCVTIDHAIALLSQR